MQHVQDIQASPHAGFALIEADSTTRAERPALTARAHSLAQLLDAAGVGAGQVIALTAPSVDALVPALMAAAQRDAAVLPYSPALPRTELDGLLASAGVEWQLRLDGDHMPRRLPVRHGPRAVTPAPTGLRLLIRTSGSSGAPRSAMFGAAQLAAAAAAANARLGLGPGDRWLACLPPWHIGGLAPFYRCAQAGATLVSLAGFAAEPASHALNHYAVSHVSLVPAMLARLLELGRPPPSSLRVALIGGQALDPGLAAAARDAGWPLCVSYGLTEMASQVAVDCDAAAGLQFGRVGRPLPGIEVRAGLPGAPARVRLRGPMLMRGYAAPQRRPGLGLEDGWHVTQDLGWLDPEGALHIAGRADEVLISAGVNVHPGRLEALLGACPQIGSVGVTGLADPTWGQRLVAVYTGSADADSVARWCREHVPGALRPRTLLRRAELPQAGPGKLDRRRLRRWVEQALAPQGPPSWD
jgi:O-succinylbenzoic acid--CoA ligase